MKLRRIIAMILVIAVACTLAGCNLSGGDTSGTTLAAAKNVNTGRDTQNLMNSISRGEHNSNAKV